MEKEKFGVDIAQIETELGWMVAGATGNGICMLEYADCREIDVELMQLEQAFGTPSTHENVHLDRLRKQLEEYFRGERREFNLPLDLVGTDFQKRVWMGLLQIPYGHTVSYAQQAAMLEMPKAVRAVANANGKNKVSIVLPCHRVIGANGTLTGYGGGLWRKQRLLEIEKRGE